MIELYKAYKFKLKPDKVQLLQLEQMVGNARFIWNKMLSMNLHRLENKYSLIWYNEMSKMLTLWKKSNEMNFLKLSYSHTLQQKLRDQERAFKDAFDKNQPLKRIPKFKKKGRDTDSIRFPNGSLLTISGEHNIVSVPKIGKVKFHRTRRIKGTIKNATISLKNEIWYISFQCLVKIKKTNKSTSSIGIDMGIKQFATVTDGRTHQQFAPLDTLKKSEEKRKKEQRNLKRMVKFSNNWRKQQKKIAKLSTRIANQRKDYLHKISTDLSKNHAMIFVENLKIKNMSTSAKGSIEEPGKNVRAKSGLNKSIRDQGWGMFFQMLEYKLNWNGGQLWKVDPKNTSRCCPVCGHTSAENRKTQSSFICTHCNYSENADIVGALNVLSRGLRAVMPVEVVA